MKGKIHNRTVFEPEKATVLSIRELTNQEKLFELELDNGESLDHKPGQFIELYLPGYGEAPFSISSSPTKDGPFELCIRAVGRVTNALHRLDRGEKVGIRGPFGNGFPVESLKGQDLLFIGGGLGLAPLRSFINYVLSKKEDYGVTTVLYGCKNPLQRIFTSELERWKELKALDCIETVDRCPVDIDWEGEVGVITKLIPRVDLDPETSYAIVCGPPVMYKFVMQELDKKNLPDDHRFLSLERRMRCGIGECGHCQIGEYYVCRDGPVFNYADIKDEEEAI
ncbi:oxidoreductase [candidate division MSBL1 archaeon SCGC-AAA259I14]|uniref:Oxidoreductase n=1 Tax=candidate division MSBL1 archaeon SCGC-AAA259I14 TaxID=1698268 RepID=A0A133UU25_9EURY|nr:oxidoreductase [candidate division MSBL1 archaeon SCGC-AAA259I14]